MHRIYVFIISIISSFSLAVRDPLRSSMQNHVNQIKAVSLLARSKGVALVETWLTSEGGPNRFLTKQFGHHSAVSHRSFCFAVGDGSRRVEDHT